MHLDQRRETVMATAGMAVVPVEVAAVSVLAAPFRSGAARFPLQARPYLTLRTQKRSSWTVAMAAPKDLTAKVEESIKSAQETCAENEVSGECVAAWDEVEELSATVADQKQRANADPLEAYCKEHPEADECRIYED